MEHRRTNPPLLGYGWEPCALPRSVQFWVFFMAGTTRQTFPMAPRLPRSLKIGRDGCVWEWGVPQNDNFSMKVLICSMIIRVILGYHTFQTHLSIHRERERWVRIFKFLSSSHIFAQEIHMTKPCHGSSCCSESQGFRVSHFCSCCWAKRWKGYERFKDCSMDVPWYWGSTRNTCRIWCIGYLEPVISHSEDCEAPWSIETTNCWVAP